MISIGSDIILGRSLRKSFKLFQVKKQTSLRSYHFPIDIMAMEMIIEYMLKVKKTPLHRLHKITWEAHKRMQKTHESKFLYSSWMQYMENLFGRWGATHFFRDASLYSSKNEAFL